MQSAEQLNTEFQLPDTLHFDEPTPGMPRVRITTPACTAELYLQGAHLTLWQPTGAEAPALFLAERSAFTLGKAIRGGIPVIFPWFGSPSNSPVPTPPGAGSHGFARTSPWTLRFAALAGDDVHLSLTLDQTDATRAQGFASFELAYELTLGRDLRARLTVANTGEAPLLFEEALHSYLTVGDSMEITVEGLGGNSYLDKTQGFTRHTQTGPLLRFEGETDRVYPDTVAPLTLHDPVLNRRLVLTRTGSHTAVTWNPGPELAAKLGDLGAEAWPHFVCLETANAGANAITLRAREACSMEMRLAVEPA